VAFKIKDTLHAVQSHLAGNGWLTKVDAGEPKAAPSEQFSASVFMDSVSVALVFANGGTREVHNVVIRVLTNMLSIPTEDVEYNLAEIVQQMVSDLIADYDLGGTINHIDVGGIYGDGISTSWGHIDIAGTFFRLAEIRLPLVVDDSGTSSP
jgi:hypothetical protein